MQWRFDNNFPAGSGASSFRGAVWRGSDAWNNLPQTYMSFDLEDEPDYEHLDWEESCPAFNYQQDIVGIGDFDAGMLDGSLAETWVCQLDEVLQGPGQPTTAWNFRMKFSDDYNWAFPGNDPIGGTEWDAQGVAAHEFGHATGRPWHFNDPGYVASPSVCVSPGAASSDQTMCAGYPVGETYWRSLETHDASSFNFVPGYD